MDQVEGGAADTRIGPRTLGAVARHEGVGGIDRAPEAEARGDTVARA